MIIQRGLVGRAIWEPGTYATDILVAAYTAYVQGGVIESSRRVFQESGGILNVSFGRRRGHTTSIIQFLRDVRPDLSHIVVSGHPYTPELIQREYPGGDGTYLTTRGFERHVRGHPTPDVLFLDLGYRQFAAHMDTILALIQPFISEGAKIIAAISDGLDTDMWHDPVAIDIEAPANVLASLGPVQYDLASSQIKTSSQ